MVGASGGTFGNGMPSIRSTTNPTTNSRALEHAFDYLFKTVKFNVFCRYETRLHFTYRRALRDFERICENPHFRGNGRANKKRNCSLAPF